MGDSFWTLDDADPPPCGLNGALGPSWQDDPAAKRRAEQVGIRLTSALEGLSDERAAAWVAAVSRPLDPGRLTSEWAVFLEEEADADQTPALLSLFQEIRTRLGGLSELDQARCMLSLDACEDHLARLPTLRWVGEHAEEVAERVCASLPPRVRGAVDLATLRLSLGETLVSLGGPLASFPSPVCELSFLDQYCRRVASDVAAPAAVWAAVPARLHRILAEIPEVGRPGTLFEDALALLGDAGGLMDLIAGLLHFGIPEDADRVQSFAGIALMFLLTEERPSGPLARCLVRHLDLNALNVSFGLDGEQLAEAHLKIMESLRPGWGEAELGRLDDALGRLRSALARHHAVEGWLVGSQDWLVSTGKEVANDLPESAASEAADLVRALLRHAGRASALAGPAVSARALFRWSVVSVLSPELSDPLWHRHARILAALQQRLARDPLVAHLLEPLAALPQIAEGTRTYPLTRDPLSVDPGLAGSPSAGVLRKLARRLALSHRLLPADEAVTDAMERAVIAVERGEDSLLSSEFSVAWGRWLGSLDGAGSAEQGEMAQAARALSASLPTLRAVVHLRRMGAELAEAAVARVEGARPAEPIARDLAWLLHLASGRLVAPSRAFSASDHAFDVLIEEGQQPLVRELLRALREELSGRLGPGDAAAAWSSITRLAADLLGFTLPLDAPPAEVAAAVSWPFAGACWSMHMGASTPLQREHVGEFQVVLDHPQLPGSRLVAGALRGFVEELTLRGEEEAAWEATLPALEQALTAHHAEAIASAFESLRDGLPAHLPAAGVPCWRGVLARGVEALGQVALGRRLERDAEFLAERLASAPGGVRDPGESDLITATLRALGQALRSRCPSQAALGLAWGLIQAEGPLLGAERWRALSWALVDQLWDALEAPERLALPRWAMQLLGVGPGAQALRAVLPAGLASTELGLSAAPRCVAALMAVAATPPDAPIARAAVAQRAVLGCSQEEADAARWAEANSRIGSLEVDGAVASALAEASWAVGAAFEVMSRARGVVGRTLDSGYVVMSGLDHAERAWHFGLIAREGLGDGPPTRTPEDFFATRFTAWRFPPEGEAASVAAQVTQIAAVLEPVAASTSRRTGFLSWLSREETHPPLPAAQARALLMACLEGGVTGGARCLALQGLGGPRVSADDLTAQIRGLGAALEQRKAAASLREGVEALVPLVPEITLGVRLARDATALAEAQPRGRSAVPAFALRRLGLALAGLMRLDHLDYPLLKTAIGPARATLPRQLCEHSSERSALESLLLSLEAGAVVR